MTLMRFDPFRELDRLSEQVMGGRGPRTMPIEAWRRYDRGVLMLTIPIAEASKPRRIPLGGQQQQELPDSGSTTSGSATADQARSSS